MLLAFGTESVVHVEKWSEHTVFYAFSQPSKVVRDGQFFIVLSSKLDMCFAPEEHALFVHRGFQKCSKNGVFCTF